MTSKPKGRWFPTARGFSLLEVVAAIGLFATGVVTLVGLLAGLAKSVGSNAETAIAASLGDPLQAHLQARATLAGSLDPIAAMMAGADDEPAANARLLYASRDGTKIGDATDPVWAEGGTDKFFVLTLRPVASGAPAPTLVVPYLAEVCWPAIGADGTPTSARSRQKITVVGAVTR